MLCLAMLCLRGSLQSISAMSQPQPLTRETQSTRAASLQSQAFRRLISFPPSRLVSSGCAAFGSARPASVVLGDAVRPELWAWDALPRLRLARKCLECRSQTGHRLTQCNLGRVYYAAQCILPHTTVLLWVC